MNKQKRVYHKLNGCKIGYIEHRYGEHRSVYAKEKNVVELRARMFFNKYDYCPWCGKKV